MLRHLLEGRHKPALFCDRFGLLAHAKELVYDLGKAPVKVPLDVEAKADVLLELAVPLL